MLDFGRFEILTFDCYGTLIDWDAGIRRALAPVLKAHGVVTDDHTLLDLYADVESGAESGDYRNYKTVLKNVLRGIGERLGFAPTGAELEDFSYSIREWPPFPDTVAALQALRQRYQLAVISNTDDDLFAATQAHLQTDFDVIITAEQVGSYKPSLHNFNRALERIGRPKESVLHVAQSIFHDIIPANRLGLANVWVNRRQEANRWLAAEPVLARPGFAVPDLQSLVGAAGLG